MLMMWGVILIVLSSAIAAQETLQEISLNCDENYDWPPVGHDAAPSFLKELKVEVVTGGEGGDKINISWAINIDASINYLTGIRILMEGEPPYHCDYNPPLAKANVTGLKEVWFYYLLPASSGQNFIQAANLPLPPAQENEDQQVDKLPYKFVEVMVPYPKPDIMISTTEAYTTDHTGQERKLTEERVQFTSLTVAIFGGLFGFMALACCYIIYKGCGTNMATLLGFSSLPTSPMVPVSVLLVYPAETAAFQKVVVALAEFLQWHGGCSVAVDMWQQGKIAELGPLRWLAEQAKSAERVIVISPQSSHRLPSLSTSGHSIPAAAHDLYPLILNMVASHARSPSELAKFWVVQLGEQGSGSLAVELRACKRFCLMKDMKKLHRNLNTQREDSKKTSGLFKFKPAIAYDEKSTVNLRDAIQQLSRHQPSSGTTKEVDPLRTVITNV